MTDLRFARVRARMTEERALEQIVAKTGVAAENLTAAHTEKMWIWQIPDGFEVPSAPAEKGRFGDTFEIDKESVATVNGALEKAAEYFDTFPGNLYWDENDNAYLITMIREHKR